MSVGSAPARDAAGATILDRVRARGRRRRRAAGIGLAAAVLAAFVVALSAGEQVLDPAQVLAALVGVGTPRTELVVLRLRMPRALTALLVGAALGLAGALFQRLLRNTLASPDVIGVGAGASAGAVLVTVVLGLPAAATPAGAVLGAVAAAALILLLARRDGVHGVRFVLVGVGVGSALTAVVSYLMITASLTTAQQTLLWLTGSVTEASWATVLLLVVACAVLVPAALVTARALPRLELGDDLATTLGLPVARVRVALIGLGVLLVAAAVAAAGPVSFVALVAGPVAARIAGPGHRTLGHAAATGALLVLVADLVARHLVPGVALPAGVVTGALGAPYLLWLLARTRSGGTP